MVRIEAVTEATPEVHEALGRLLPQLNPRLPVPTMERLQAIIADPAATLLVARDGHEIVGTTDKGLPILRRARQDMASGDPRQGPPQDFLDARQKAVEAAAVGCVAIKQIFEPRLAPIGAVAVREALYIGTPVIATDNGMRPEGVYLIPPADAGRLRDAVCESLSSKLTRRATGGDGA